MPTANTLKNLRIELASSVFTEPPSPDAFLPGEKPHRMQRFAACNWSDGDPGDPIDDWKLAIYEAHKLSAGRRRALKYIVRHIIRKHVEGTGWSTVGWKSGRGSAAAVLNGVKGLANDKLLAMRHEDGDKGWGWYESADQRITSVSPRAMQFAWCIMHTKRPVGSVPEDMTAQQIADSLTEQTREAVVKVALREIGGTWEGRRYITQPGRSAASTYAALERRGFIRWTKKTPGDRWGKGRWFWEIPAGSRLVEVAAAIDSKVTLAMLTGAR
jgi:hypothetical protein